MISVAEASSIILNNLWNGSDEQVELLNSLNRALTEDVIADRDFPPYDRVTMDGIAIAHSGYSKGNRKFKIEGISAAGAPQKKMSSDENCYEVMTGAILPIGCDSVVRYEDLKINDGVAEIIPNTIIKGDNIHSQGNDLKTNGLVLGKGSLISTAEIPILASIGKSSVWVRKIPKTAIVSTGDELIEIDQTPEQHQVRRSNVFALAASLKKFNIDSNLFHLRDDEQLMKKSLGKILNDHHLIILSGGVSKGKFDFIPSVLESNGIKNHFHQVKQRPGKPLWFGTGAGKTVFALPGNPVSTFLCYFKYIEPWLMNSLGSKHFQSYAILDTDFSFEPALTYFLQVKVNNKSGQLFATPIPGGGSGDFVNLKDVDGFLELPEDGKLFRKGDAYPLISFRN